MLEIILPPKKLAKPRDHFARKKGLHEVVLVILRTLDPDGEWELVRPEDVPDFVKDPATIKRLVAGEICQDETQGPHWYRAEEIHH